MRLGAFCANLKRMQLNKLELKQLRQMAHSLKPVIRIGQQGVHPALLEEAKTALSHHQLIKIKLNSSRDQSMIDDLCHNLDALAVQKIGAVLCLYKENPQRDSIINSTK